MLTAHTWWGAWAPRIVMVLAVMAWAGPGAQWAAGQEGAETEAAETEAASEESEEEAAPTVWAELSLEEKVELLKDSSLQVGDEGTVSSSLFTLTDTLWTCLAAFLVFFMQAGFSLVETGFTRAKNACNIIMKNVVDFSMGTVTFWALGFGLMFGATNGFFGTTNFLFDAEATSPDNVPFGWAFLIFQTVFCATAATIVSGAMAERTKFVSYLFYTVGITAIIYPIAGSWAWGSLWQGEGWLEAWGFADFAGSTVVHSVGGWAALAGAIVVGPRIGKFVGGRAVPIPGHNIPIAALGVFILWLGWFGFNPGSTTAVGGGDFAFIAVTTNISAAGGALGALLTAWALFKKPDATFTLNGALAGLVAITSGCDQIPVPFALLTGFLAGCLVVGSCLFFDKIRIDDPVGAISVHGVCGAFGTLCTGLFASGAGLFVGGGTELVIAQLVGIGAYFVWAFGASLALFTAIKYTIGLRVSDQEQLDGLDIHEHGMAAYPVGWLATADYGPSAPAGGSAMPRPASAPASSGHPATV